MLAVRFTCVYVGLQSKLITGTLALLSAKRREQNLGRSRAVPSNSIFTKGDENISYHFAMSRNENGKTDAYLSRETM